MQGKAQAANQPFRAQGRPAPPEEMEKPSKRGHQHNGHGGQQEVGQQRVLSKALGEGAEHRRSRSEIPGQGDVDGEGPQQGHKQQRAAREEQCESGKDKGTTKAGR